MSQADAVRFAAEDRGFVYAAVRRIVGSADDAEDVTQDTLLLAYRHRDAFRGDSRYRTWLYRIAATTALGHLRRRRRTLGRLVDGDCARQAVEGQSDPAELPSAAVENAEMRAVMQRALRDLAPAYRDVLLARAEASEHEVANQLGISRANVKIRCHRARKHLRTAIDRLETKAA